ncbi:LacI family DNA-binding transcriptional regulator [Polymorphobacter sp.]|uniref:LacI family DNA-binding transcriptional regulator n=1 Tax=Polymorphobacter sp. TaxID=1909290 RepID=UPI003F6E4801
MRRRAITSRDVAERAGVSQASVSRAFTPGATLSPALRERIKKAAEELDYIPNSIASSLTRARTNTIALIIGDTDNPFYIHVLRAFLAALQARGQQALTFTVAPGATSDDAIRQVLRFRVDGIILTAAQVSTRVVSLCEDRGIPIILFNRYIPGADLPVVRCDNFGGGRLMAQALIAAGARSFALIKGDPMGTTSQDRAKGFFAGLAEAGLAAAAVTALEGGSTYNGALEAFSRAYGADDALPDAVFAVNDIMAMAAIDRFRHQLGRRVPEDVMVAGFDNLPEGARLPYRLTTLDQPVGKMVAETLALLDQRRSGEATERLVPSRLIWRDTVPGLAPAAAIPPPAPARSQS